MALALLPAVLTPYTQDLVVKIAISAVFALSLQLLVGTTGLVSLGHAAFLGIAGYVTVLATGERGAGSLPWLLLLSVGAAAAYALFVGALSLRTKGVYFIMVTLAFAQMAYFVFHDTKVAGGSDGIFLYSKPVLEWGGHTLLDLDNKRHLYYAVWLALVLTYGLLALIGRSRFGHALAGIRVNEQRMRAAGFSTYGYKLAAFVIAGALAGVAGFLHVVKDGAVNPELLSWHESGAVLLMIILGGIGSLRGRGDRCRGVHAAQGILPERGPAGAAGEPLAAHPRADHHRLRSPAAPGPDRAAGPPAGSAPWLKRCCFAAKG